MILGEALCCRARSCIIAVSNPRPSLFICYCPLSPSHFVVIIFLHQLSFLLFLLVFCLHVLFPPPLFFPYSLISSSSSLSSVFFSFTFLVFSLLFLSFLFSSSFYLLECFTFAFDKILALYSFSEGSS
jgi:hypothetical protein